MQGFNCPICVTAELSAPRRAGGRWFAMCSTCHSETEVEPFAHGEDARLDFRIRGPLSNAARREADLHRRRTCF